MMTNDFWAIFSIVVGLVLVGNLLLGVLKSRDVDFRAYSADPNRYGPWMTAASLTGTVVGGGMFLATGTMGYEAGIVGYIVGLVYLMGLVLMGLFAGSIRKTMDEMHRETLIDCVRAAFSDRVSWMFSFVSVIIYLFLLAGQFVALWYVAHYLSTVLGNPAVIWTLTSLAALTTLAYPIVGGLRKDVQTDVLQMILILAACVPIAIAFIDPWTSISLKTLPPDLLTGKAYGKLFLVGLIVFYTPSFLVRMDFWQRVRAARTDTAAKLGFFIAAVASCLFFFLFTTIGIWARTLGLRACPEFCV